MSSRVLAALVLVMCTTACSTVAPVTSIVDRDRTIYVAMSSQAATKRLCEALGADWSRYVARQAANASETGQVWPREQGTYGCYAGPSTGANATVHVIVCTHGDDACLAHEEMHREHGHFHP